MTIHNAKYKGKMLEGISLHHAPVYIDNRGSFCQTWTSGQIDSIGMRGDFKQVNTAISRHGVIRGMHRQNQTKLVYPLTGRIFDVVLDVTTGDWFGIELKPFEILHVPAQYAHGYMVLSDSAIVQYVVDMPYRQSEEEVFSWNGYGIEWPLTITPVLSMKDENTCHVSRK